MIISFLLKKKLMINEEESIVNPIEQFKLRSVSNNYIGDYKRNYRNKIRSSTIIPKISKNNIFNSKSKKMNTKNIRNMTIIAYLKL